MHLPNTRHNFYIYMHYTQNVIIIQTIFETFYHKEDDFQKFPTFPTL